jgi:hypothetical protein
VERIDLRAALPVILETHTHRQGEEDGEVLLKDITAGNPAADVADHTTKPNAQEFELAPGPPELVRMGVAPDHDRGAFGHPPVALP